MGYTNKQIDTKKTLVVQKINRTSCSKDVINYTTEYVTWTASQNRTNIKLKT